MPASSIHIFAGMTEWKHKQKQVNLKLREAYILTVAIHPNGVKQSRESNIKRDSNYLYDP